MQNQTSCVFVNMEPWTGCFRGCGVRREEEEEEEYTLRQREDKKIEDKKEGMSYSEDMGTVRGWKVEKEKVEFFENANTLWCHV